MTNPTVPVASTPITLPTGNFTVPENVHCVLVGNSGGGKTGAMLVRGREVLQSDDGLIIIDPEGEVSAQLIEFAANPENGIGKTIHHLRPASPTHTFGLAILDVPDRDPQKCHNAAIRAAAILEQFLAYGDLGPRVLKLLYVGLLACALNGLPLAMLPDIYGGSAQLLRQRLGSAFQYQFLREIWNELEALWARRPTDFVTYVESIISRMVPILSSPLMRRIFGQRTGIDFTSLLASGDVVLLDLGDLESKDSVLIGKAFFSCIYHTALQRTLHGQRRVHVFSDEVADYVDEDFSRGFDRLRKRSVYITAVVQRLSQLLNPDDPASAALGAILTNSRCKIAFGGLLPDEAAVVADIMFGGWVTLDTVWKSGSLTPTVIGSEKITLHAEARGESAAEILAVAKSRMRASASTRSASTASIAADMTGSSQGLSSGTVLLPDAGLIEPATQLTHSRNRSSGHNRASSRATNTTNASATSSSEGEANSESSGTAKAVSRVRTSHEAIVNVFAELPSESFSLEEKKAAAIGLLMNLPPRACIVKLQGAAPVLTRTPDLKPAFKTAEFRDLMLPLYQARLLRSPLLRPVGDIDAELKTTITTAFAETPPAETEDFDFTIPEPMPSPRTPPTLRLVKGDNDEP